MSVRLAPAYVRSSYYTAATRGRGWTLRMGRAGLLLRTNKVSGLDGKGEGREREREIERRENSLGRLKASQSNVEGQDGRSFGSVRVLCC